MDINKVAGVDGKLFPSTLKDVRSLMKDELEDWISF